MKFPPLEAQTLLGNKVTFPDRVLGKKTLITMVFEKRGAYVKPQMQADQWKAFWVENLKAKGIDFYEIPMMSGTYSIGRGLVDGWMRDGINEALHDKVACFYGNKNKYAEALNINDLTDCYVCLFG